MNRLSHIVSTRATYVGLGAMVLLIAFNLRSHSVVGGPPPESDRPWYTRPELDSTPNSFRLFDDDGYGGRSHLVNIGAVPPNTMHSLKKTPLHDKATSVSWNLPRGVIVVLYQDIDWAHPGRQYAIWGSGSDPDVKRHSFNNCVSAWAWFRVTK